MTFTKFGKFSCTLNFVDLHNVLLGWLSPDYGRLLIKPDTTVWEFKSGNNSQNICQNTVTLDNNSLRAFPPDALLMVIRLEFKVKMYGVLS